MLNKRPTVLVVDDEQHVCELLSEALGEQGYVCQSVNSAAEALKWLKETKFDLALLDIKMPFTSGMDLLKKMSTSFPETSILMTTAVNDTNTAVEAMKSGALDYILKPFSIEQLRARVAKVLREKALREDVPLKAARHEDKPNWAQLDAIARGVEVNVDQQDSHSRIVIDKTIEVARRLALPDDDIIEWATAQRELATAKERKMLWAVGQFGPKPGVEDGPERQS